MTGPSALLSVAVNADVEQAVSKLTKFDRQVKALDVQARKGIEAKIGASFDPAAFKAYEERVAKAARYARDREAFKVTLGANFSNAGFTAYQQAVARAKKEAEALRVQEREQSDKRIADAKRTLRRIATLGISGGGGGSTGGSGGGGGHSTTRTEERSFARGTVRGAVGRGAGFIGGGLAGGLAGFVSAEGIKSSIESTTQLVRQAEILHHYTGMSAQSALQFQAVAGALGVSSKGLGTGFRTLATAMNNALVQPTKANTAAFRELGISQQDVKAHSHDLGGMLGLVADKLNKLHPGAQRTALAAKLLGRNWQQLAPLLMEGSKGMDEQLKTAKALGVTLGGDPLKNIQKLHDAEINLKLAQTGLSVQFTEHVAPALIKVTMGAIKLAEAARKELAPTFKALSPIVKDVGHWLGQNKDIVRDLVIAFAGFKILRTVGGWFGGLSNDVKKVVGFGRGVAGMFRGQGEAAAASAAEVDVLAASYERLAAAQGAAGKGGALTTAERAAGSGLVLPPGVKGAEAAKGAATAERSVASRAGGALAAAGKVFLPIAAISGLINAASGSGGGFGGATRRFISGATMGLLPVSRLGQSPGEAAQKLQKQMDDAKRGDLNKLQSLGRSADAAARGLRGIANDKDVKAFHALAQSAGARVANARITGMEHQQGASQFSDERTQLAIVTGTLSKIQGKYRNAGALAAIEYASGLEKNGQIPRGATDKLISDLEAKFPALAAYLNAQGALSMKQLGDQLKVNKVQGNAIDLVNSLKTTFGWLPGFTQTAGDSTQAKLRTAMDSLRHIMKTGTAAQRAAAEPELEKLKVVYGQYMDALKGRTKDATDDAARKIHSLGGHWKNLGSVVDTVVNKQIVPAINAAIPPLQKLLGLMPAGVPKAPTQTPAGTAANQRKLGHATGGIVSSPMFMVGEEAPAHKEVVIATNPAYRGRNVGLWQQAGKMLGIRGFAQGGVTGIEQQIAGLKGELANPWSNADPAGIKAQIAALEKDLKAAKRDAAAQARSERQAASAERRAASATQRAAERAQRAAERAAEKAAKAAAKMSAETKDFLRSSAGYQSVGLNGSVLVPSQSIGAQIRGAELSNALTVAQNAGNVGAQTSVLSKEVVFDKGLLGKDAKQLAAIKAALKRPGLSKVARANLLASEYALLQEIGGVSGNLGSAMSSLSSLTGSDGGSGGFNLMPGSIRAPTPYDLRTERPGRSQRVTNHNTMHFHVHRADDVPAVVDALERVTAGGGHLSARLRAAGVR